MPLAVSLHEFIQDHNVLIQPTASISDFHKNHPNFFKATLLVNHIFRAVSMIAFKLVLPLSALASAGICFAGSLFYRLTVETNCAYKFALPAFAGSIAFPIALPGLFNLINGIAFVSLGMLAATLLSLIPLAAYLAYIVLTVSYDVDNR